MTVLTSSPSSNSLFPKDSHREWEQRKTTTMGLQKGSWGGGLWLQSQEGQDLCVSATTDQLIFKTSTRVVNTRPWIFQISTRRRIFWETFAMVTHCMENKRTVTLTCICNWIREGTDLVCNTTAQRKHKTTRSFRNLVLMRTQKHWYIVQDSTWLLWVEFEYNSSCHELSWVLCHT